MGTPTNGKAKSEKRGGDAEERLGFGFAPGESEHYFILTYPNKSDDDRVYVSEHFKWEAEREEQPISLGSGHGPDASKLKVALARPKWEAIADAAKAEFNRRLRELGQPTGTWKKGKQTPLSRLLGKELTLLCWAIEDAPPTSIPRAIANWRGLSPEERWWLFTMTNAATGHAQHGRNRGWRVAVRYALTENPLAGSEAEDRKPIPAQSQMTFGLFDDNP
jgi:hypothetical protein